MKYLKERIPSVAQNKNWWQKQEAFVLYTLCSTSLLSNQTSLYPLLINTLLLYPSIVLTFFRSILLLFNPSVVQTFFCSTYLLFFSSIFLPRIVLSLYCSRLLLSFLSIVPHFCHFTRLHLLTVTTLYCLNTSLFHSSFVEQLGRLS